MRKKNKSRSIKILSEKIVKTIKENTYTFKKSHTTKTKITKQKKKKITIPQDVPEYVEREKDLKENRGRVKHRLIVFYSKKEIIMAFSPKKGTIDGIQVESFALEKATWGRHSYSELG